MKWTLVERFPSQVSTPHYTEYRRRSLVASAAEATKVRRQESRARVRKQKESGGVFQLKTFRFFTHGPTFRSDGSNKVSKKFTNFGKIDRKYASDNAEGPMRNI